MTDLLSTDLPLTPFPDHTQLPECDGTFVKNLQEHPQSILQQLAEKLRSLPAEQLALLGISVDDLE
ncbi:MAG: hypothetical protein B0A82_06025 [Alkalinema sp. CACIAM 70d]|nr:MAG: hypothetical protein B0A82_06025 [Alkalinema sp. CACIAM 70d]